MFKRAALVILALTLVAGGATAADAASKKKTHSLTVTVQLVTISQTGNPPVSGTSKDVGSSSGTYGEGAIRQVTTYGTQGLGTFQGTGTAFGKHGTFKYTLKGSGMGDAQGNATFSGAGKIAGGTDQFKGVTGSFTFSGSRTNGSNVATFQVKGKLKY